MISKPKKDSPERREHTRLKHSFILSYSDQQNPDKKIEITQLKNISKGGMCFITTKNFPSETMLNIELRTPYLAGVTQLKGTVLESLPKAKDILFETRLEFKNLDHEAKFLLEKLSEFFTND